MSLVCPTSLRTLAAGLAGTALLVAGGAPAAAAAPARPTAVPGPQLELLDRGLVAAVTGQGVFLSWRLLGQEVTGRSATGMTGPDFRVYRDGTLVATVTDSTNFLDKSGSATSTYRVSAVVKGVEVDAGASVSPWAKPF